MKLIRETNKEYIGKTWDHYLKLTSDNGCFAVKEYVNGGEEIVDAMVKHLKNILAVQMKKEIDYMIKEVNGIL